MCTREGEISGKDYNDVIVSEVSIENLELNQLRDVRINSKIKRDYPL